MLADTLVDGYSIPEGCYDELLAPGGEPRAHVAAMVQTLRRMGPQALLDAGRRRDTIFMQQGITFEVAGSDGARRDRPFPLDLVPRVLTAGEWTVIKRGLAQRIRALNAFVDDVYHAREIVRAGVVPWSLIVSRPSFARPVHGIRAPGGVYTHVSGCDLVRGGSGWAQIAEDGYREAGTEFLMQTDDAPGRTLLAELRSAIDDAASPLDAVLLVAELIPGRLDYRKGATYVDSPLAHVLDIGAGVCQDFVHLGLNLLRARGIAARYVSGYLYTHSHNGDAAAGARAAGQPSVEVDTHAWIEALIPQADERPRWVGVDPTNRGFAGERHVKIGHGRHYADVPPIRGIYRGPARSTLEASVTMTAL